MGCCFDTLATFKGYKEGYKGWCSARAHLLELELRAQTSLNRSYAFAPLADSDTLTLFWDDQKGGRPSMDPYCKLCYSSKGLLILFYYSVRGLSGCEQSE